MKGGEYFNRFVESYKDLINQDEKKFLVENFSASIPIEEPATKNKRVLRK
jgi:hypothetical protein